MGFKIPQYPVELTNAGWQKKKGLLAKIAGETGIGDLLKALNSEYDKIDWLKFQLAISAKGQGSKRTKQDVKDAYEIALVEAKKLLKVDSAARDVERKAAMLVLKWKKDKAIPGASVKVAEEVGAKAKEFCYAVTLGTIMDALDKERKECDESVDKIANEYKKLNDTFRHYVNGFESACAGKTLSDYPTIWKENIRGVGTILAIVAKDNKDFATEWAIWKGFSNTQTKPEDEEKFKKQISMLIKVAASLKPKVAKLP